MSNGKTEIPTTAFLSARYCAAHSGAKDPKARCLLAGWPGGLSAKCECEGIPPDNMEDILASVREREARSLQSAELGLHEDNVAGVEEEIPRPRRKRFIAE